jgi:hypothetical protein
MNRTRDDYGCVAWLSPERDKGNEGMSGLLGYPGHGTLPRQRVVFLIHVNTTILT